MKNTILALFLLIGCNKEFVEPAKTTNERFYCEIDGKIFRPRNNGDIFDSVLYTDFNPNNYRIWIIAINKLQSGNTITLAHNFENDKGIGVFSISNSDTDANFLKANSEQFIAKGGFIEITKLDTVSRKISGRFEFDAESKDNSNRISEIRNGEFNNLSY
jgi:hypothetical protein